MKRTARRTRTRVKAVTKKICDIPDANRTQKPNTVQPVTPFPLSTHRSALCIQFYTDSIMIFLSHSRQPCIGYGLMQMQYSFFTAHLSDRNPTELQSLHPQHLSTTYSNFVSLESVTRFTQFFLKSILILSYSLSPTLMSLKFSLQIFYPVMSGGKAAGKWR